MNEFFLVNNRSIVVGDTTIHQLRMHDFDEWFTAAKAVKDYLKTHSDEIDTRFLKAHISHVLTLLSKSAHLEESALISIAEASESLLIQLVDAMIKVNDAFFSEKESKRKRRRKSQSSAGDQISWFDTFQFMIESGHRHEDIMQMSYGTFTGYLKAAQKNHAAKMRVQANLMRAAQHANAKAFTKLIDELKPGED
ncbi:hypothetical protein D9K79_11570 [Acinetobacter cumulans]|uniref:Uncharacterized protein n=1 Tax=Acinetobacter cumulans TaxID=2136182 RepID=A0ABX9U5D7_9GAMM|nr:hypothetical protein [Acinetobacter cumulans]RLL42999.1 hypothetical protein D9K79_11570 [Acinetobacter cumulans]